jgi:hypothetical protein
LFTSQDSETSVKNEVAVFEAVWVTLRYHYVVDVLAGLALSIPALWIGTTWYQIDRARTKSRL